MHAFARRALAVLALPSLAAFAQAPFEVLGLHSDQTLAQARAAAESLGGQCAALRNAGTRHVNVHLACEYIPCGERPDAAGRCDRSDTASSTLQLAGQPVIRIGLEAPDESARVTRITILFDGDRTPVADDLATRFGPPDADASDDPSWTHSQRTRWTRGGYRLGLLDSPHLVILVADPAEGETGQP